MSPRYRVGTGEELEFFDMSVRARKIALALSATGSRSSNRTAAAMDQALTDHPDADRYETLNAVVVERGVHPGLKDNGHGGVMHSDTDVAAYVVSYLQRWEATS